MAKKSKLNLINDDLTWNADRRYKVNSVVQLNGEDYQNITGKNSNPELLIDWQKIYTDIAISDVTGLSTALNDLQLNKEDKGVNSSKIAYVESSGIDLTAEIGNLRKPFLTIDAALDALPATGGVVKIGIGTFNSPAPSKIKSNVLFIGSGKPITNSTITQIDEFTKPTISSPTKLVGGTILNGNFNFSFKNNITLKELGIDCGKVWVDTFNGGIPVDCLVSAQNVSFPPQPTSPQTIGVKINNVSVLGYAATATTHNTLIENTYNPEIQGLSTYFGIYGLIVKNCGANVVNFDGHGHNLAAIICKSDTFSYGQSINLSNIYVSSIASYDTAGIMLDGGTGILQRVNIDNYNTDYAKYGIQSLSSAIVDMVNISNCNFYKCTQNAILLWASVKNANISNVNVDGVTVESGIAVFADSNNSKTITNCRVTNAGHSGFFLNASGTGKILVTNLESYNNTTSFNLSGNVYGINVTKNTAQVGNFITTDTRPYKVYTALLSQTGTNAPTATVLENTLGGTVTFERSGVGNYSAVSVGNLFTLYKTVVFNSSGQFVGTYNFYPANTSRVALNNVNVSGVVADSLMQKLSIEIRVYL